VYNSRRDSGPPRFELFAESFGGLSGACGGVKMAWRGNADNEEFDEE
jgi:hypothetical protein